MENWPVGKKKKKKGENRKKIKIESTKIAAPMQPGSHQHMAIQKHQGIVKAPLASKLESVEHWIKKRNLGELAKPSRQRATNRRRKKNNDVRDIRVPKNAL